MHSPIELAGESGGHCACCGYDSRTVWGYASSDDGTSAAYFVPWTVDKPDHPPNLDFLIGGWGSAPANAKVLVAWLYSLEHRSFRVVDSHSRPAANSDLCSKALTRAEVLSDPEFFSRLWHGGSSRSHWPTARTPAMQTSCRWVLQNPFGSG